MLAALLLQLLQDKEPAWTPERVRELSTHELVLRHPRPAEQRAFLDDKTFHSWHPLAFELHERLDRGEELSADEWRELLIGRGFVRMRSRWPVGVPLTLRVERPWLLAEGAIHMQPTLSGNADVPLAQLHADTPPPMCGEGLVQMLQRERHQELGLLPRGTWHIGFRTEIEQRILDGSGTRLPGLRSWSGEFAFDVEIVESFDDALPPVSDERWARMLRSGLRVEASAPDDGRHLAWIVLDLDRAHWPADLHLECEIELRCGGQPYGTSQFVAADVPEPHQNRVNGSALLERLPWRIAHGEEGAAGWSVVVRGVRGDALFDWNCERWWAGEVEVPLADLIRR